MFLLLILNILLVSCQDNDKLIFTMIHFRHGARSPVLSEGTDTFGEKWENPGELTGIGERMHYVLGYRNRMRYIIKKKLLSEKFNPDELVVITTNFNRTIMSVSSHLQGLYPQNKNLGYILTENQLKNSNPPVNVSSTEIQEEITKLQNNALPHNMTLIPFEIREGFLVMYSMSGCTGAMKEFNSSETKNLETASKEFNEKYAEKVDKITGEIPHNYSSFEIYSVCDDFIAGYTEGKNMDSFKKTGVDFDEFFGFCKRVTGYLFSEYLFQGNNTRLLEGSKTMELLINYTKKSIDADINSKKSPKLLILSAHDVTITQQELFILQSLGLNIEDYYRFPTYASQIAFEISRKDDNNKNRKYSDYFVNYYFNDELILNMTADEFINKVEPNIFTEEKINQFCGYNDSNKTNNSQSYFSIKRRKTYKTPFIVMTCLFGVSLLAIIMLLALLCRKNANYIPQDASFNSTNIKN